MTDEPSAPDSDPSGPAPLSENGSRQVRPAADVDSSQIKQFVTTIKNAEQQVGEHVIRSLQQPDTVAILTTVVLGPDGQQRVVSAALNPERMQQVQELLNRAEEEREEE
ncbi:MAG: hypothetical protein MI861_07085, partial [Pirellulales bacterium]|nr:hypothetical protein [Pirellulales bacterium]